MPIGAEELDGTGERNCDFDNDLYMDYGLLVMGHSIMARIISSFFLSNSASIAPYEWLLSSIIDTFFLSFLRLANVGTGCFFIGFIYTGFGFCGSGPSTWVELSISVLGGTGRSMTEGEVGFSMLEVFVTEIWILPWLSSHSLWLIVHFEPHYLVLLLPLQHWWEIAMATINLLPIHSAQRQVSLYWFFIILHAPEDEHKIYTHKNLTHRPFRKDWERWSQPTDGSAFHHYMAALKGYLHAWEDSQSSKSGHAKVGSC